MLLRIDDVVSGMAKKKEKKNGPQEVEKQTDQAETFGDARDG